MSRLDDIEARLFEYGDYGPDPTADLRYLLKVARAAEGARRPDDLPRGSHACWATERLDRISAALEAKP